MKKLVMSGLAGLMAVSLVSDIAFAKRGVREVLSKEAVRERILKRIGETKISESAFESLYKTRQREVLDVLAEGMRSEGIGLPKEHLTKILELTETNEAFKKATQSDSGLSLVESVGLALSVKEGVRDGSLELSAKELAQLETAADNALHLVGNLASLNPVLLSQRVLEQPTKIEHIAVLAMLRQSSQIEALLKDYTQAERDSWNTQLASYKSNIAGKTPEEAYIESIRDVVAKERGIEKTEVTEEMLKEKLEEIRRCKA